MRKIVTYPNSILEQKATLVELPLDKETQNLIREMFAIVEGKGVGLAAPQVGVSKQICILHLNPEELGKRAVKKLKGNVVMLNPEISFYSEVKSLMVEGCLSFPEQYYEIFRPANINVEFDTIENMEDFMQGTSPRIVRKKLAVDGWVARIIQHEVDHLNGNLFINLGGKKLEQQEMIGVEVVD